MSEQNINVGSMLSVGSKLRGVYRIDSYLSSGGFGNTYVATNVEFDEVVAIKEFFMKGVTQRDANNTTVSVSNTENKNLFDEQLQKFKKEARRLRRLKSPHIVSVHDLFEENGTAYYVMDYIDGENLSIRLKRLQKPLSEAEVMGYLPQILDALECVHQEGIWHLDLKPANIMVDRNGNVSLIDFGASKQRSNKGGATTSTAVSFTNGYAPREQMEQNLEKFGPWTDLYALGATLYNLLANKRPPMPSDIDDDRSADKHLALPLPTDISEKMRNLILRLMTTDRLDRPQSVAEVRKMVNEKNSITGADTVETIDAEDTMVVGKESDTPSQPKVERAKVKIEQQQSQQRTTPSTPKTKKSWFQKYWVIAIASFAAVGVAAWQFGGGNSSENTTTDSGKIVQEKSKKTETKTVNKITCNNSLGKFQYTGEVDANNIPNGMGEAIFDNGKYYKGPFVKGNLRGKDGLFKYQNGDTFVGSFKDNLFDDGTYTVAETGEYFTGTFENGSPAHGTWYDKKGNVLEKI